MQAIRDQPGCKCHIAPPVGGSCAKIAAGLDHPRRFAEECQRRVEMLEDPIRECQVDAGVLERPFGLRDEAKLVDSGISLSDRVDIDADHAMAASAKVG